MTKRRTLRQRKNRVPSRSLNHEALEKRELLAAEIGPRLISVSANSGEQFDLGRSTQLTESPREITFRFDGDQQLDPNTLSAFRFIASGGDGGFAEGNEVEIEPGFVGLQDGSRIVVARFASDLPDDLYRFSISGFDDTSAGVSALRNVDGDIFRPTTTADPIAPSQDILVNIEVGPRVVAVVPQPIDYTTTPVSQTRDVIHVYFNDDPLGNPNASAITTSGQPTDPTVVRTEFYNLYLTGDTVESGDDVAITPTSVTYEASLNRATLTFAQDLEDYSADGSGTFRLRVGSSQALPTTLSPQSDDLAGDVGDTFSAAQDLAISFGATGDSSVTVSGEIQPIDGNTTQWPGIDIAGVRDDRRDAQIVGRADTEDGVTVLRYNFASLYGTDASGFNLENAITPAQQQRTREILDLYSKHLGVQFIETEDQGLQIVTGDLRALVETASTGPGLPYQAYRVNDADPGQGVLILDSGETWFDGYGLSPDARPSWFVEALRGVGSLLGIGNTFEQVPGTASGSFDQLYNAALFPTTGAAADFSIEPDFLSTSDIIPGQALHRPEIRDADLYRFTVDKPGKIAVETFAERLLDTSLLDTDLKLFRLNPETNQFDLVARNGDFYGDDSFIGIDVTTDEGGATATYVLGVTAAGNDDYNPNIEGSGGGGTSQGRYDVRISYQSTDVNTITDTNQSQLDGDSDGQQGGNFNFWFRVAKTADEALADEPRTLFVNGGSGSNVNNSGALDAPLRTIDFALSVARPGDIVRLLPDAGDDGLVNTTDDNRAYEIGRASNGAVLNDGASLEVPRGVTVMIDAGAILKLRSAKISVGSETIDEDRSLAALQVLGVPVFVDQDGSVVDGSVDITSYREQSRDGDLLGVDTNPLSTVPAPGDWAGIEFRNDFDISEGRPVWETEGIFLDYVSHADIRYGGGSVQLTDPIVTPLQLLESRPTLIYNQISLSRDAAISADPNSFAETNFSAPQFQQASLQRFGTTFATDYVRVGPFIRGNTVVDNSINGLFIRVLTPAGQEREPITVSGRFDDSDITHVLSEVLTLEGQPGGPLLLEERPDVVSVNVNPTAGANVGTLNPGDVLDYRVTFVTENGFESLASDATRTAIVSVSGALTLDNLPAAPEQFSGRKIYRNDGAGNFVLVSMLDRATSSFTDDGTTRGGLLSDAALANATDTRLLPRTNARLSIDPGVVLKLDSARIEATFGADFYAEGQDGNPVIFTSRVDDRFGAGGTFDTNNDGLFFEDASSVAPTPGDWSGLVFRQNSTASLDYATIAFAGGDSATSGDLAFFNPVEILQADVRVANSTFADNADGDNGDFDIRDGAGFNGAASVFVRGAQPVLVENTFVDNQGAAISINPDALNYLSVRDTGRGTGVIDLFETDSDNQGPLIAANRLGNNEINGLFIRNESLTTESVWDDTDIVHVVEESVYAWNHHYRSGLRLKSDPNQSLVVKLQNGGSLSANRLRTDIADAIGGTLQILGQPGFPVILTSLADDSVGAGFTPGGLAQNDTDNADNTPGTDWAGLVIQPGANDRNVAIVSEAERAVATAAGLNAIPTTAQILGSLAQDETSADENRRLGFNIRGTLSQNGDLDVFTFTANGGTEVFIDIDDTDFGLDAVVELVDINGNILALSDSSSRESVDPDLLTNNIGPNSVLPLRKSGEDTFETPNSLDPGMRVILPGNSENPNNQFYVRVRSSNLRPGDSSLRLGTTSLVGAGLSSGQYQLSIRLRETDEVAGSTIRLADIRYAFNAIDVPAAPTHSPLAAESVEELAANGLDVNDGGAAFNNGTGEGSAQFANGDADPLGALSFSDRGVLRVSGTLGNNVLQSNAQFGLLSEQDIDVYRVDLFSNIQEPNIIGENRFISTTFDIDYADQLGRPNTSISVYTAGGQLVLHSRDSNVADDQGRPTEGNDQTNLDAGSAGSLDAYIGPVEMQVGTYYVVVSNSQMIPQTLDQLFEANPVATNIRILPIDSSRRLAEEGFDNINLSLDSNFAFDTTEVAALNTAAELPTLSPIFDDTSLVPYKLEDVRLFLTLDGGLTGNNRSTLITVDPFTGRLERTIGEFAQPVGDLAIRRDGELFGYSLGPATGNQTNGNTGQFLNISSADASANSAGDDGLTLRTNNDAGTGTAVDANLQTIFNGLAFEPPTSTAATPVNNLNVPDTQRAFAVGNREDALFGFNLEVPPELRRNVVFSVVANTGAATNRGSTNGNLDRDFGNGPYTESFGPGSNKRELGVLDVGQFADSTPDPAGNFVDGGTVTGLALDPVQRQSLMYAVTDGGYVYTFDPGDTRAVDVNLGDPNQYFDVINATNHGLVEPHPDDFVSNANDFVQFSSLTLGPRITERVDGTGLGRFAQVLFGTTDQGWIYTMEIDPVTNEVVPSHVLVDGNYAVQLVDDFGFPLNESPTGAAFSIREENLWHQTTDRGTSFAEDHGLFVAPDQSRIRTIGGSSLYFGNQINGNQADNTLDGGNGTLNPGGAHGSVISRPMSLEEYAQGDKPTLYFSYFLETENDPDFDPPSNGINNQQVDAFRVFAAGDDGQWRLLSTNDSYRSFSNVPSSDEYDLFALNGGIPIQETFENTNEWRQARVDLSPLAGDKNVQIRFDFSTAGGMHSQFVTTGLLTEIQATPGSDLVTGSTFALADGDNFFFFDSTTFEFVPGAAINVPEPGTIGDGQLLSFVDDTGTTTTLRLTLGAEVTANDVNFSAADTAAELATRIVTRLQALSPNLDAVSSGDQITAPLANSFSLEPANFGGSTDSQFLSNGNVPVFFNDSMTMAQVRDSIRQSLANGFGSRDPITDVTTATPENYPEYGTNRIRIFDKRLIFNTSVLGFSSFLPGDEFGAASSASVSNGQVNTRPGSNNAIEGLYIDDIVIGFAERGEVVYNAPSNRNFSVLPEQRTFTFNDQQVPEFPNEILVGDYTLEVRTSAEYGIPEDYDPIRLGLDEQFGFGRSFDTNDRLADGVTLIAPAASDLIDGDTFVLGNGVNTVTFEFDSDGIVSTGRVGVPFEISGVGTGLTGDSTEIARSLRDAINSPASRNALGIRAGSGDSADAGITTSSRVELFGSTIQVNPSTGRFVEVDLVAEETFYGRESARTLPSVDHDNQLAVDAIFYDTFARATVTDYVNGNTDTLVAVGKIGDSVGTGNANELIPGGQFGLADNDADIIKIYLNAGDTIDIDLDTEGFTKTFPLTSPFLQVFQDVPGGNPVFVPTIVTARSPGETADGVSITGFQVPIDGAGYYYVRVNTSAFGFIGDTLAGDYQLTIRPSGLVGRDVLFVDYHFDHGDTNRFRDQGQIIIESNFIRDFGNAGILATFDPGTVNVDEDANFTSTPLDRRIGGAATLRNVNSDRLVPGTVISNNVVIANGGTGIVFSGEVAGADDSPAPVPFGRIVNNTVVGDGTGTGISVSGGSAPTVLNNIIAGFATGTDIAGNSAATVTGANAFQNNATDSTRAVSGTSFVLPASAPLFQDEAGGIYIPAENSQIIDSSFASLNDRSSFVNTVKEPIGISASPIIAPSFDAYGIPRFDDPDVASSGGVGSNVFIDRGAIDRADFVRPVASLVAPLDFVAAVGTSIVGGDVDPSESFVQLEQGTVEFFEIQLTDPSGSGPDASTITPESVLLTENGRQLQPDVDYTFGYSDNSRLIRLTPLAGLWRTDAVYEITLNNQTRIAYQSLPGDEITDGDQIIVTDDAGNSVTFEYESGFSLEVPQTTLLTVTGTETSFNDGDVFTIIAPDGNSLNFEINRSGSVSVGNVAIELNGASTTTSTRDAILAAFSGNVPGMTGVPISTFLDLAPVAVGREQIQLGTLEGHQGPGAIAGIDVSGQAGGVADGDVFTYTTGGEVFSFEFDNDGTLVDANNIAIGFSRQATPLVLAQAIVDAVRSQPAGLDGATVTEPGIAVFGGSPSDQIDLSASSLNQLGSPGVTPSLTLTVPEDATGAAIDTTSFTITSDGTSINFSYTTDPNASSADRLILVDAADTADVIAQKTAVVIAGGFPDDLAPIAVGETVVLGESNDQTVLFADDASGITLSGIAGGAIAVDFLTTSPSTSTAASLVAAIRSAVSDGLLNVETFAPGGGTILISGASALQGGPAGTTPVSIGTLTPAIADLAGNPVSETRANDETRFSIIMPDVLFDFGDAPDSYGTLLASNGARHTINDTLLPRLGRSIDSESNGQPVNQDDSLLNVAVTTPNASIFSADPLSVVNTTLVAINAVPVGGETLTIAIDGVAQTFELVDLNSNPADGNIPVPISIDTSLTDEENIALVNARLVEVVQGAITQNGDGLSIASASASSMAIESIDDEDGVPTGQLLDADSNQVFNVFLRRGSDPTNVQVSDVLGFLNPLDPAGTSIDVAVAGSGLLQMWIDFDGNGVFESNAGEQVVTNLPVSGDADGSSFVTVNVVTPVNAEPGNTWMRVRISEAGDLSPTVGAVGGEVEDYRVEIIPVQLPTPVDDTGYAIVEDTTLDTDVMNLDPVGANDINLGADLTVGFLPASFILGRQPINGTVVLDNATGSFVYTPAPDFFGIDTFTYRVSAQQNESVADIPDDAFATVTITVAPDNDAPGAQDADITALEDLPRVITAGELLVGAVGDADPQYISDATDPLGQLIESFLNEANQDSQLSIASLRGSAGTAIDANNAATAAGNLAIASSGTGLDILVTDAAAGDLFSVSYAGQTETFQLLALDAEPQEGAVVVAIVAGDTPAAIADRLATAITDRFMADALPLTGTANGTTVEVRVADVAFAVTDNRDDSLNDELVTVALIATGGVIVTLNELPTPTEAPSPANTAPDAGDTVTVSVAGQSFSFEFLADGATAAAGSIGVPMPVFASPAGPSATLNADRLAATNLLINSIVAALDSANLPATAQVANLNNPISFNLEPASVSAGKSFDTVRGSFIPLFDSYDDLIELRYLSGLDLNRDNPAPVGLGLVDQFEFQVRDDRLSIQLQDNQFVYGDDVLSSPATASIDVAPQNDVPVLRADQVMGAEDTATVIDPATLLANDSAARPTAADEDATGTTNDGALTLETVTMVDPSQGTVVIDATGNIVFTPAADLFGEILFTYSASDMGVDESIDGTRDVASLTSVDGTVTVNVAAVNDPPTANERAFALAESDAAGSGPVFIFTANDLIQGGAGETANLPGNFDPALGAPFDESDQVLRIARFETAQGAVDEMDLVGVGLETLTLQSDAGAALGTTPGGTFEFDFIDGVFSVGRFILPDDYNELFPSPTVAVESLVYVVADNGNPNARSTDDPASVPATITFTVSATNDAPTFTINAPLVGGVPNVAVLEDNVGVQLPGFATNILGGNATSLDESRDELVTFSFDPVKNVDVVNSGLFSQLPTLSDDGTLTIFPAVDQIGSATLVVTATDNAASGSRSSDQTFVINVRPVNDAPRFRNTLDQPIADQRDADDAYSVSRVDSDNDGQIDDATITYTLKEDNTQALGITTDDFFIPLVTGTEAGFNRIGLLDVFNVGPDNEADPSALGGSQELSFVQAGNPPTAGITGRLTDRGGVLTPVFDSANNLIGLNYRPPTDFNASFAGMDSFTYSVQDNSTVGDETFDLLAGSLVPNRLTSTNTVQLVLNPVNDRPEFNAATLNIPVPEDSALVEFPGYATSISAGPINTAFDEVDTINGQLVEFSVVSLDFPLADAADFFTVYPTINSQSGELAFQPAGDIFGSFRFEVTLNDSNRDGTVSNNTIRGDLISSIPITLSIDVRPVNDPPVLNTAADPLAFQLLEEGTFEILVEGDNTSPGLLDVFFPGPSVGRTDESADISPAPGGNQTLSLGNPVPTASAQGGTITLDTSGTSPKLVYQPRPNFVGMDSFIYTVIDDGQTIGLDGVLRDDPRIASNIVTFEVLPVNDAPLFSGAGDVGSLEDAGLVTFPGWATNVQAGPTTAVDEINGFGIIPPQELEFLFTPVDDSGAGLFLTGPTATIDRSTGTATLSYQTVPDANGTAVFVAQLRDLGPNQNGIGDNPLSQPRTFTINVEAVNDPPSISLVNPTITLNEDSGPFSVVQVDPFSPGPADEQDQTVSFDVSVPDEFLSVFTDAPTIDANGTLRFTPAPDQNTENANGPVPVQVIARDNLGEQAAAVTFEIVINEANDAPRANSDQVTSDEDSVLVLSVDDLLANDVDPDLLTNPNEVVRVVLPPFSTSVSGAAVTFDSATGQITYDPTGAVSLQALAPGEALTDSFAYSLIDSTDLVSNLVTVGITVDGINDAPTLQVDTPTLNPDGPTIFNPLANDFDVDGTIDASSIQINLQPSFGSLQVGADGTLTYTPFGSFSAEDVFRYSVADNLGARSEEQLVSISANASPTAVDDAAGTFLGESFILNVASNDFDVDGTLNLASITIVNAPLRGQAIPQSNGTVQYLPDPDFVGRDSFDYRIADSEGRLSNVATATIQVVASRLQNPDRFSDVNDDGFVTAIDALLIINRLAQSGGDPIIVGPSDQGPPYFDVTGDQNVTALDALRVVNELAAINNGSSFSGEQVFTAPLQAASTVSAEGEAFGQDQIFNQLAGQPSDKIVDVSSPVVPLDQAIEVLASEAESTDSDESLSAIDDAFADLL